MKPEQASLSLLGVTRSKAKMYEYGVPLAYHIKIVRNPAQLFTLAIGLLGDISAASNRGHKSPLTEGLTKERQQSLTFAGKKFQDEQTLFNHNIRKKNQHFVWFRVKTLTAKTTE